MARSTHAPPRPGQAQGNMKGGGGSGLGPDAKEAPLPLAHPPSGRGPKEKDMAHAATRAIGEMKGAPGLAGRGPSAKGVAWSTRRRPL